MSKQLALALRAPAEHGEFVHSGKRHDTVIVWKAQCRPQWGKIKPADDLLAAMADHLGEIDRYLGLYAQIHENFRVPSFLSVPRSFDRLDVVRRQGRDAGKGSGGFALAWQHLHFLGHYAFRGKRNPIDLEAVLAGIDWE